MKSFPADAKGSFSRIWTVKMAKTKDPGQGVLLLWGEDGLEEVPAFEQKHESESVHDAPPPQETVTVATPLASPLGTPFGGKYRSLDDFALNPDNTFSDEENVTRVRAGDGDWDCCNDPDEYVRESEERKARKKARQSARGTAEKLRQRPSVFARAADALSRRDYSKKELTQKLRRGLKEDENPAEVEKAVKRLEDLGYLSDARFAENRARVRASSLGNARIRRELRQSGVADDNVTAAMESIAESEEIRAYRVWARRYKELPADRKERDRQIRYLLYRGFSMDSINKVLRGRVELPDEPVSYWS